MRNMGKRGQLTIFIIIGIILLFSAALIIYIQKSVTQFKPPVEVSLETVSRELQPLQKFVTDCANIVAKEGIIQAGLHGGYIDSSKISVNDADPTEGEGVSMPPGGDIKVPYWFYMKSRNNCEENCEFAAKQPSLYRSAATGDSIEEQLDRYVQEKLSSCTGDFNEFRSKGFEIKQSQIKATTTITKTDVFVQLDYPLTVKFSGREETMSKFGIRLPVNIGKLYDTAAELANKESGTHYIDFLGMNLINVYSGLDESKLPPLGDYEFFVGKSKSWMKSEVKSKIEDALSIHVQALQTVGSLNFQGNYYRGNDDLAKGLYDLFILPNITKTRGVQTEFDYLPWWPTYLKVSPSEGELIKPDSTSGIDPILSTFGINSYKFAYDVSYPILVTLSDPTAFGGEGYTFAFAMEANIRNNNFMTSDTALLSFSGRAAQSLACDPKNYNSGEVTVDVKDSETKEPVDAAEVYFSLGKESCFIGETGKNDSKVSFKSKMPVGIGALVVSKDGYISKTIKFGTKLDVKQEISVDLDRYVDVNIYTERIPIVNGSQGLHPIAAVPGLDTTEEATITMIRLPENPGQEAYTVAVQLKGTDTSAKSIKLVPGNYQIIGNLIDREKTIVPEEKFCYDSEWYNQYGFGSQKCDTIDATEFDIFPKGGVLLDSFTIDGDSLKDAKGIVVPLFSVPDGYTRDENGVTNIVHSDLGQSGNIEQYSRDYNELVKPRFTK